MYCICPPWVVATTIRRTGHAEIDTELAQSCEARRATVSRPTQGGGWVVGRIKIRLEPSGFCPRAADVGTARAGKRDAREESATTRGTAGAACALRAEHPLEQRQRAR